MRWREYTLNCYSRAVDKGGTGGGGDASHPHPPAPFPHLFFDVKMENIKFLHVNNIWDFSLFVEEDISDKKWIVFSEFVVLAVNWSTTVTYNEFASFCF